MNLDEPARMRLRGWRLPDPRETRLAFLDECSHTLLPIGSAHVANGQDALHRKHVLDRSAAGYMDARVQRLRGKECAFREHMRDLERAGKRRLRLAQLDNVTRAKRGFRIGWVSGQQHVGGQVPPDLARQTLSATVAG